MTGWRVVKAAADTLADEALAAGAPAAEVRTLQAVSPHAIRHYVAQYILEEGGLAYQDIPAIFGHASAVVTEQVYARLSEDRLLEIATPPPRADDHSGGVLNHEQLPASLSRLQAPCKALAQRPLAHHALPSSTSGPPCDR